MKTKQQVSKDVTTRQGDAIGQSFPLTEVPPNHRYGWCVAESKAKTCGGWIKGLEFGKTCQMLPNLNTCSYSCITFKCIQPPQNHEMSSEKKYVSPKQTT